MASSGILHRVALVRTDVSEELSASIIRVTRIGELGTTVIVFLRSVRWLLVTATFLVHRFLSPWWWRRYVSPKRRFLLEPHGVTSQKTPFLIELLCASSSKLSVRKKNRRLFLPIASCLLDYSIRLFQCRISVIGDYKRVMNWLTMELSAPREATSCVAIWLFPSTL
jgi:hypothetical protein